jgi:hypothetical protein
MRERVQAEIFEVFRMTYDLEYTCRAHSGATPECESSQIGEKGRHGLEQLIIYQGRRLGS